VLRIFLVADILIVASQSARQDFASAIPSSEGQELH